MLNRCISIVTITLGVVFLLSSSATEAQAAVEKTLERGAEVLAQEIVESLPQDKKPLLAVLDFSDLSDCVSAFGRLTSEELVTKLFKTKRARVVERGLLKKALAELKFNLSELVDPGRAKQLGKQVGADAIVSGTVSDLGASVKINARVIEVERGDVLAAAGVEIAKDESVTRLSSQTLSCPQKEKGGMPPQVTQASPDEPKPTPNVTAKTERPKFENQGMRITVKSLKKEGNVLKVELAYRNLLDIGKSDIPLNINTNTNGNRYIADDEGEQWLLQQDSPFSKGNWTAFPPQVNVRVPLSFMAVGGTSGRNFNLVLDHYCSSNCDSVGNQVRVIIRNITAE